MTFISVAAITGENAVTREAGHEVHAAICTALDVGDDVTCDFSGVRVFVSSFLGAAFANLYERYSGDRMNASITIENMPAYGRDALLLVLKSARAHYQV